MKKAGLILILVMIAFVCSACSLNLANIMGSKLKTAETSDKLMEYTDITEEILDEETTDENLCDNDETDAFYGVWCISCKDESNAEKSALELSDKGFDAQVITTTDWENLNPEKFYVVTAGVCKTRQEAEQLLANVKREGYSDAYVKYTGERVCEESDDVA